MTDAARKSPKSSSPKPGAPYALAIFDLDGTLADSFPWFQRVFNDVADRYGFRRVAAHEVEGLRGKGPRELLAHLDVPVWKLPLIAAHMRRLKSRHLHDIPLFPGAREMLQDLAGAGVRLALVSSDHEANVRSQLGSDTAALFTQFACGASLFGKAAKFRQVVRRSGVAPARTIAIGDELRDIEAARAAGIACGAVAWGYADVAALRAQQPDRMFATMAEISAQLAREHDP
jgi:phosphoglycolate phosphatase